MHYSFRFVLAALAVWRVTHLVAREDGPFDLLRRLRRAFAERIFGRLFGCFYCLSVWVALPFAFFVSLSAPEWVVTWFALSGAAILLERATREPFEIEIEESQSELLRSRARGAGHD
jgi:hypothetical protein